MKTIQTLLLKGVVVVGPKSCALAFIQSNPWNHQAKVAFVVAWYFETPREIRIFEYLCQWCKAVGATHITVASLAPNHTIDRYYKSLGLRNAENSFIRAL